MTQDAHGARMCVTCGDVAVAARVTELLPGRRALVEVQDETAPACREEVSIALVDAQVGDVVLVHAAEALGVLR